MVSPRDRLTASFRADIVRGHSGPRESPCAPQVSGACYWTLVSLPRQHRPRIVTFNRKISGFSTVWAHERREANSLEKAA